MIQFNLLPDVKLNYIRAQRTKRLVMVTSFIVAAASLSVLVLLFFGVQVLQKKHINDLTKDIKENTQKLKETPDLDKILTVQNQLNSISSLHDQKPKMSRLGGYLEQITPSTLIITELDVNHDTSKGGKTTMSFKGRADATLTINKFVDTLKFTKFRYPALDDKGQQRVDQNGSPVFEEKNAFSEVVLTSYTVETNQQTNQIEVTYEVGLKFDPLIFDSTKNIELAVPQGFITTRSELEKPSDLFNTAVPSNGGAQ